MTPYPPTREHAKPHPTVGDSTQVISVDEASPVGALTVYEVSLDELFDIDSCGETTDKGPNPIKELVKLQLGPKLE